MYVRWKEENSCVERLHTLTAYLVESKRSKGQKTPRQRVVAYLGRVKTSQIKGGSIPWTYWFKVLLALAEAEVSTEVFQKTVEALSQRIPKPTDEEWRADIQELLTRFGRDNEYIQRLHAAIERYLPCSDQVVSGHYS